MSSDVQSTRGSATASACLGAQGNDHFLSNSFRLSLIFKISLLSRDPSTFESRRPHESVITNNMVRKLNSSNVQTTIKLGLARDRRARSGEWSIAKVKWNFEAVTKFHCERTSRRTNDWIKIILRLKTISIKNNNQLKTTKRDILTICLNILLYNQTVNKRIQKRVPCSIQ